jgi:SprT protein
MLKQQALDRIEECFCIAEEKSGKKVPRVPVLFNSRLRTTAGRASFDLGPNGKRIPQRIDLSTKLMNLNGQDFIKDTPGHEAAHVIADYLYNSKGHDQHWKRVMDWIGQSAERCHDMKVPKQRKFIYKTESGLELEVSTVIHNRIQRGQLRIAKETKESFGSHNFIKEIRV